MSNLSYFLVPGHSTWRTDSFYVKFQRTLYGKNTPLIKSMQHVNNFNFDVFTRSSVIYFNIYLNNVIT